MLRKYIMLFILGILFSLSSVYSMEIINCTSDSIDWTCEQNKTCICTISGTCTNGNLMIYKSIANPLCFPPIINSVARINWGKCSSPSGEVKVRASCEENQSSEKIVTIVYAETTTTSEITTTTEQTTTTTRSTTTTIQRLTTTTQSIPTKEQCPYDCCVYEEDYQNKLCDSGLECCDDHTCKESCETSGGSGKFFIIIVIIIILIAGFFIFRKLKVKKPVERPSFY